MGNDAWNRFFFFLAAAVTAEQLLVQAVAFEETENKLSHWRKYEAFYNRCVLCIVYRVSRSRSMHMKYNCVRLPLLLCRHRSLVVAHQIRCEPKRNFRIRLNHLLYRLWFWYVQRSSSWIVCTQVSTWEGKRVYMLCVCRVCHQPSIIIVGHKKRAQMYEKIWPLDILCECERKWCTRTMCVPFRTFPRSMFFF